MQTDQSQDLEGNIQLGGTDEEIKTADGFRTENGRPGSAASSQHSAGGLDGQTFNTLDEPVSETIVSHKNLGKNKLTIGVLCQKRDLERIWQKLRIVINPLNKVDTDARRKEIRNWDLWGPFFFCLMLAA